MSLSARAAAVKANLRHGSDDEEDEVPRRPSNRREASVVQHGPEGEPREEVVRKHSEPLLVEDLGPPPEHAKSARRAPSVKLRMRDSDSDSDSRSARSRPAKHGGGPRGGGSDSLKTANPTSKNPDSQSSGSPATSSKETPQGGRTAPSSARPSRAALRESLAPGGSRLHGSALLRSLRQQSSSDEGDDHSRRSGASSPLSVRAQPSHTPATTPPARCPGTAASSSRAIRHTPLLEAAGT